MTTCIPVHAMIEGEDAITLEAGTRVHAALRAQLDKGGQACVDFAGVTTFASLFFNAAIGQLLAAYKPQELAERIRFENLSPNGQKVLQRVIDNAKRFYSEPDYRKAQERVLAAMTGNA